MYLVEAAGVVVRFGGVTALDGLDLKVEAGSISGVIGPNGAGKTSLFNVLTGFVRPQSGSLHFQGRSLAGLASHQITALGIARTFQNLHLFETMTAAENVLVGQHTRLRAGFWSAVFRTRSERSEETDAVVRAAALLALVGLRGSENAVAKSLPYGAQRRLEMARALAASPSLLLLDEPTSGMNPSESREMVALVRRVRDELGITILLIEHQMPVVMNVCETVTVLDRGRTIAEGPPHAIQRDARVIEAYLGRSGAARLSHPVGSERRA